ncbi:hypothetical protein BO94DRAFT_529676 [Aspergillus sclerotioniger CBS 115572]|uniref:Myb-like domain-containing protein n=1 Tax=Aspergillus sclerotioniger CBS 115572 TaxID=1450535 RepID=A0A317XDM9_9EURO|nr:hypothetical protein BO94DRAFT_529676 [Aspergillus sclerotioniger CBS 115572]PWY96281.1 hypothetical protein BO94DRAFT_529676 [Aspergillus sclerotioniger CBS 115572]
MSSPIPYEYEEDDDASDFKLEIQQSQTSAPLPAPPSYGPTSSSTNNPPAQTSVTRRSTRGTRAQALEDLQSSLPRSSVEAYSDVLVRTVEDHAPVPATIGGENYRVTQNGIVTWTPKEKEVLYSVLDRKGKDGIKEISRHLGSKSELEVQEHLKLLHTGLEKQHLKDRHTRTVILGDVPAAAEISGECCDALDQYAELVALEEQLAEDVAGKQKHHDLWIIDRKAAEELGQEIKTQGADPGANSSAHLTADLLNMKKWIRLSERFFMNFGGARLEDNWVNVAFAGETPSMTADAFADFYALTVSLTRRLVQSTLFFAMSRRRNMRQTGNEKANVVRSRDVQTAVNVLNMQRDSSDFWVGLARRCSLRVEDSRHRKGWKAVHMEHSDVEDILSAQVPFEFESGERSISQGRSASRVGRATDSEDADASDAESEPPSPAESLPSSPLSSPGEEKPTDPEDDHAEHVDEQMSRLEEVDLWKLIGQPPQSLEAQIEEDQARGTHRRKPVGERKTTADLVDWRDRTFYRNEWEEYGHDIVDLHDELSENRRKRRRVDQQTDEQPSSAPILKHLSPRPTAGLVQEEGDEGSDYENNEDGGEEDDEGDDDERNGVEENYEDYEEMAVDEPTPAKSDIEESENNDATGGDEGEDDGDDDDDDDSDEEGGEEEHYQEMALDEPSPAKYEAEETPEKEATPEESPVSELASRLIYELEKGHSDPKHTPRIRTQDTGSSAFSTPSKPNETVRPMRRSARLQKAAQTAPEDDISFSSDDNLPSPHERTVSEEEEDDDEGGMPLYSHPMSPADSSD